MVVRKTKYVKNKKTGKLEGSISLEGKVAPTPRPSSNFRDFVAKKEAEASPERLTQMKAAQKLSKKALAEIEYRQALEAEMSQYGVDEEKILEARELKEIYLSAIAPDAPDFTPELSLQRIVPDEDGDQNIFYGEIYLGLDKIGSVTAKPEYGHEFSFDSQDDEKFWKAEVELAYSDHSYPRDDDYASYLNSLTTPVTLDEFIQE